MASIDDLMTRIESGLRDALGAYDDLEHAMECVHEKDFTRRHVIAMREAVEKFDGPKYMRDDLKEVLKMVEAG